jgi:hypothetical protein
LTCSSHRFTRWDAQLLYLLPVLLLLLLLVVTIMVVVQALLLLLLLLVMPGCLQVQLLCVRNMQGENVRLFSPRQPGRMNYNK